MIRVFLERRESIDESVDTQSGRDDIQDRVGFEKQQNDDASVVT